MSGEQEIINKVNEGILNLKKKGVVHHDRIGKNGKVVWASDFEEINDEVTLIFRTGRAGRNGP